ncbi:hypothetical protein [Natronobiforma cellulositropha]|uniref:hypothetical protein n=1 Tax=Natronobiforma cellulositropha TaxID=1679076 RepID=UPI0021D5A386|nr:hypothetical protein [Natronobiforma cellulositropha]
MVVSDTSPILNLALVDRLGLLTAQFDSLIVPETVRKELLAGEAAVERLESFLEREFVTLTSSPR